LAIDNPNSNPNPEAKNLLRKQNDVIYRTSVQIPLEHSAIVAQC